MNKKLVSVTLSVAMISALLAGCGSTVSTDTATAASSATPAAEATSEAAVAATSEAAVAATSEAAVAATSKATTDEAVIYSTGPHGEAGVNANTVTLTDDQIEKVKAGNYTAAICMHYGGNDWATAQINGLTQTFDELGIKIVATTDANFSAEQQVSDIETVMAQDPDIIISIPTDATATADAYKRASEAGITLVFMDNVPDGMEAGTDYVSCVAADNYGNGCIAADILGDSLNGEGDIAMVYYDADFFVTNQRDQGFRDELASKFPNVNIACEKGFTDENGCSEQGDAVLTQYPDIDGIYATWDVPMEGVLSSVRAAGKEGQIKLAANDLGNNIAKEIAIGNVAGVSAQMPFDQGIAEAKLAALSLLGEECPAYVVAPAKRVDSTNVLEAYKDVYHVEAPDWLVEAADSTSAK